MSVRTPRIKGVETTNWRIKVSLVEMKLEDDHDIHLVVSAPGKPSKTMITEFPDTTCKGAASSPKKAAMAKARSKLIARCGSPPSSSFRHLTGSATLTGVGFFDIPHGQTGVAPNAIELHPVLKFSAPNCQRNRSFAWKAGVSALPARVIDRPPMLGPDERVDERRL